MILNKCIEYTLNILRFIATRNEGMYSSEYLYHKLKVPYRYLSRLLIDLASYGFLKSISGNICRFVFAKDLGEINLTLIINTLKGSDGLCNYILGYSCCITDKSYVINDT